GQATHARARLRRGAAVRTRRAARHMTRLVAVALVLVLGWGCERGREATPRADASPSPTVIDRQTLEPLLVRGLDAAVEDRAIAEQLDVAGALASAPVS